jgi:hypothetical protein
MFCVETSDTACNKELNLLNKRNSTFHPHEMYTIQTEDRQQQIDELEKQLKRGKSEISLLRKSMNKYIEGIDETARSELDTAYRQKVKAGSEDKDEILAVLVEPIPELPGYQSIFYECLVESVYNTEQIVTIHRFRLYLHYQL